MSQPRHGFAPRLPLALSGQRIGLLGGSFNPAHEGHRLISEIALKRLGLDAVWWIVSPGNPLKSHADLAPLAARIAHARAVAGTPRIVVTGFEADRGSVYTIDTLVYLKARLPAVNFIWLMGADNLANVHRWRQWRRIFALLPVAVVDRPGWHLKAVASRAALAHARRRIRPEQARRLFAHSARPAWTLLTGPLSSQSSTALRALHAKPR